MLRFVLSGIVVLAVAGCATQRYGRAAPVSAAERSAYTCETLRLEIAKTEAFLEDVRHQRSSVSGAHVLGALGDFGIGNVMEGDAAEQSGRVRLEQLRSIKVDKRCL